MRVSKHKEMEMEMESELESTRLLNFITLTLIYLTTLFHTLIASTLPTRAVLQSLPFIIYLFFFLYLFDSVLFSLMSFLKNTIFAWIFFLTISTIVSKQIFSISFLSHQAFLCIRAKLSHIQRELSVHFYYSL